MVPRLDMIDWSPISTAVSLAHVPSAERRHTSFSSTTARQAPLTSGAKAQSLRPASSTLPSPVSRNTRQPESVATKIAVMMYFLSGRFKTGQREWPSGTDNVLSCRLLWWQVGFGAPASGAALEHVSVM